MIASTPVNDEGQSGHAWGRARWVGVADVRDAVIVAWSVHEVRWDESHDAGTHGSHHARVVTFLREQGVEAVVVDHMGEGMARMMRTMGIHVLPASPGDAQLSVLNAVAGL
ncbi:NifB/NifX family molybdenum-iron cluster-binding protein [Tessaracoccus sp. Z1128]